MSTNEFMNECVRINKPCKFESLAMTWDIYEKIKHKNNGMKYL